MKSCQGSGSPIFAQIFDIPVCWSYFHKLSFFKKFLLSFPLFWWNHVKIELGVTYKKWGGLTWDWGEFFHRAYVYETLVKWVEFRGEINVSIDGLWNYVHHENDSLSILLLVELLNFSK